MSKHDDIHDFLQRSDGADFAFYFGTMPAVEGTPASPLYIFCHSTPDQALGVMSELAKGFEFRAQDHELWFCTGQVMVIGGGRTTELPNGPRFVVKPAIYEPVKQTQARSEYIHVIEMNHNPPKHMIFMRDGLESQKYEPIDVLDVVDIHGQDQLDYFAGLYKWGTPDAYPKKAGVVKNHGNSN